MARALRRRPHLRSSTLKWFCVLNYKSKVILSACAVKECADHEHDEFGVKGLITSTNIDVK